MLFGSWLIVYKVSLASFYMAWPWALAKLSKVVLRQAVEPRLYALAILLKLQLVNYTMFLTAVATSSTAFGDLNFLSIVFIAQF